MYYHPYKYFYPFKYNFGYYPLPYNNYINSQIARINQSIYNSGTMDGVFQNSTIIQSGVGMGCTEPQPTGISTHTDQFTDSID